jgi:hypothetical protein
MSMSSQGEAPSAAASAASPPAFQFMGETAKDEQAQEGDGEDDEEESEESNDDDDEDDEEDDDEVDDDDDDDEEEVKGEIPDDLCKGVSSVLIRSWVVERAVSAAAGGGNARVVLEVINVAPGQNVLHVQSLVKESDPAWTVSLESLTMGGKDKRGRVNMWPTTPGKRSNRLGTGPRTVIRTENAVDGDGNALTAGQVAKAVHGEDAVICKVPYIVAMGCAAHASTVYGASPIKWIDGFLDKLDEVHQRKHQMTAEAWSLKEGRRLFEQLVSRAKCDTEKQARRPTGRKTAKKKSKKAPKKRTKKTQSATRGKAKAAEVEGGAAPMPPTKRSSSKQQTMPEFATPRRSGDKDEDSHMVSPAFENSDDDGSVKMLSFAGGKSGSEENKQPESGSEEDKQLKAVLAKSLEEAKSLKEQGNDDMYESDDMDRAGNSGVDELKDMMKLVLAGLGEVKAENKSLVANLGEMKKKVGDMAVRIAHNEQWASAMATREAADQVGGAAAASADEKVAPRGAQGAPRGAATAKPCGVTNEKVPGGATDEEPCGATMEMPCGDTKTPRGVNDAVAVSPAWSPPAGGRMHVTDLGGRQGNDDAVDAAHTLEAPLTARVCVLRGVDAAEEDGKGASHVSRGETQRAFAAAVAAGLGWPDGSVKIDAHVFVSRSNYSSVIVKIDPGMKNALKMWPTLMTGKRLDEMNKTLRKEFRHEDAEIVWYLPREAKTSWTVERGYVALTKAGLEGMSPDQIRDECKKRWPLGPPFRGGGAQYRRR